MNESKCGTFSEGELLSEDVLKMNLKFCGSNVEIFSSSRILPPELVSIGDNCQIDEDVRIFAGKGVDIGAFVHFGVGSMIFGGGSCRVGDYVSISPGTKIVTGTDLAVDGALTNPRVPEDRRLVKRSTTTIESFAVIYTNSIIFPGVCVGHGAVVSAGSVVHHDLVPWGIYAGNPLVQIGQREPPSEYSRN